MNQNTSSQLDIDKIESLFHIRVQPATLEAPQSVPLRESHQVLRRFLYLSPCCLLPLFLAAAKHFLLQRHHPGLLCHRFWWWSSIQHSDKASMGYIKEGFDACGDQSEGRCAAEPVP